MHVEPPNATSLAINLQVTDAQGMYLDPTPGDYAILAAGQPTPVGSKFVVMTMAKSDQNCMGLVNHGGQATTGTVHVIATTGSAVQATFDVMFGADHLTGMFAALSCQASLIGKNTCQ